MRHLILLLILSISIFSCSKDDNTTIKEYLEKNNIEAEFHDSGIYYTIEKLGTGGHPNINSTVTTHYKGYYLDDEEFDSSHGGDPLKFGLRQVIKGWQIGIPFFQKGGKGTLFIPPHLGYGSNPPGDIRDNAPLAFDIELIDFK